jgi:ASC-1-like (ASCH) protein
MIANVHDLKIWPEYFAAVVDGTKTFEVRRNDRNFRVGDIVELREWEQDATPRHDVGAYTGRSTFRTVTYVLVDGDGLEPGYVVLGLRELS